MLAYHECFLLLCLQLESCNILTNSKTGNLSLACTLLFRSAKQEICQFHKKKHVYCKKESLTLRVILFTNIKKVFLAKIKFFEQECPNICEISIPNFDSLILNPIFLNGRPSEAHTR